MNLLTPGDSHSGLVVRDLEKTYRGGVVANRGLDIDVRPGEVFGLLGPNGAGKTTLVKQIIGLLAPTSGTIHLDNEDLVSHPARARDLCSFLPQGELPIDSFSLLEVVELVGRIRGGDRREVRRRAEELVNDLELGQWAKESGLKLSGGVKRLTGFAMAAIWPSRLLILDEPTNDVDPLRRRLLWKRIRRAREEGTAVLLVTHNVLEAELVVDRLAVIDDGAIVAQGSPSELKREDQGRLRLQLTLDSDLASPESPSFVLEELRLDRRLHLVIDEARAAEAIQWAGAKAAHGEVEEYALTGTTLEDVYLRLIGRDDALEGADREARPA